MKQTAVDFAVEKLEKFIPSGNQIAIDVILEKAKATEKERMIDFAKYCLNNAKYLNFDKALFNVEEYYQIFKSK